MNNIMKSLSKNAKARLIAAINADIERMEATGKGLATDGNVMVANNVREAIETLTLASAYKLEKAIMKAEYYDPTKDKFRFGPRKINPTDYLAFCDEAGIENPLKKDVEELSGAWFN